MNNFQPGFLRGNIGIFTIYLSSVYTLKLQYYFYLFVIYASMGTIYFKPLNYIKCSHKI